MSASEPLDIKNYIGLTGDTPIRFIASDVDGTLVNDAKSVDPEVVNAVRAARESGIRVAIASGRPTGGAPSARTPPRRVRGPPPAPPRTPRAM